MYGITVWIKYRRSCDYNGTGISKGTGFREFPSWKCPLSVFRPSCRKGPSHPDSSWKRSCSATAIPDVWGKGAPPPKTRPVPLRGGTSAAYLSIREERSPQSWADCYYYASWQPSDRHLSKAVGTTSPWDIPVFSGLVEPYPLTSREVEPLLVERTRGSTWSSEDPSCTRAAFFRRVVPPTQWTASIM